NDGQNPIAKLIRHLGGRRRQDPEGQDKDDDQRVLDDTGEDRWCDESIEHSTEHTTQRDPKIELRELAWIRAILGQVPMTEESPDEFSPSRHRLRRTRLGE